MRAFVLPMLLSLVLAGCGEAPRSSVAPASTTPSQETPSPQVVPPSVTPSAASPPASATPPMASPTPTSDPCSAVRKVVERSATLAEGARTLAVETPPARVDCGALMRTSWSNGDPARWANRDDVPHVAATFGTSDGAFVFETPEIMKGLDEASGRWLFVMTTSDTSIPHEATVLYRIEATFVEPDPGPIDLTLRIEYVPGR